ncbi:MAG: HD domain-containing protein, partial [Patescibacteria group bacterium]|nr:HD domain-containing protein [Patescibacteria group bacterium]
TQERLAGYEAGADGYVVKPFDHDELLATVRVHFRLRQAQEQLWKANNELRQFNTQLEDVIRRRSTEVIATRDITIFALAKLAESRDPETGEHLDRMRRYSKLLAELLLEDSEYSDRIDSAFVAGIYQASPLHDIGKVGIPDAILLKPGRLTFEEFEIMKRHAVIGYETLCEAAAQGPSGGFLDMAADVARHHHEKFDGTGYPDGLAGEEIPLSARIVAMADVFDALTSARVYKPAFDPGVAKALIEKESGKHFDPEIVKAFQRGYDQFLEIWSRSPRRQIVPMDPLLMGV